MNLIKIPTIAIIVVLIMMIIPIIHASEETQITVTIVGEPIINLDETNRFISAIVEIQNYDASGDGYYYMQLIQKETGNILSEEEILISPKGNQLWGTRIGGILDDEKIMKGGKPVLGEYEIKVITEFRRSPLDVERALLSLVAEGRAQVEVGEEAGIVYLVDLGTGSGDE